MCGCWSLYSVNLIVSCDLTEIFLISWSKPTNQTEEASHSLQITSVTQLLWPTCTEPELIRGERVFTGLFCACFQPWVCMWLLDFLTMQKLSKAPTPLVSPFPASFIPEFLVSLLLVPIVIPCLKWQLLIHLPLSAFDKYHPGSYISPQKALRQSKQRETFEPVFQWSIQQTGQNT